MHTSSPGFNISEHHLPRLELITSEWQIASDLSFCDMVMWYPHGASDATHAQARPVTAQTTLPQDMTGAAPHSSLSSLLDHVALTGKSVTNTAHYPNVPPGVSAWPVRWREETIAVVTVHQNLVSQ